MNEQRTKSPLRRLIPVLLASGLILAALLMLPELLDAITVKVLPSLTIEAGDHFPWPDDFLGEGEKGKHDLFYGTDISRINTRIPGEHTLELVSGEETFQVTVHIVDTIAPTGEVQDIVAKTPYVPTADDFFTVRKDITALTASFKAPPDFTLEGDQQVTLLLTDAGGNETEFSAKLTMIFDLEAPVITGVKEILVYAEDAVAYRSGITVTDDRDPAPKLTVDSSAVDLSTPGQYPLIYTATDYTGNTTTQSTTVTVREKQPGYATVETIYAAADALLAKILREDMTVTQQVKAIGRQVRNYYVYTGTSIKDDWLQGAYRMLQDGGGDCFNYYALAKLLLERLDIPNIDVVKVKNHSEDSQHFWSLVSVDGGETYYHFDATPRNDDTTFFLVTDAFMDDYSASHRNCFNRDKSLYPATPKEPLG